MSLSEGRVRPLAVVIIRRNNQILLSPGYDKVKDSHFYRLIGGGVEFGETSLEALKRELQEELAAELVNIRLLNVIENIFTYNGQQGHEIGFIYEAEFKDKSNYDKEKFSILDSHVDNYAIWVEINEKNAPIVFPAGSGALILKNKK